MELEDIQLKATGQLKSVPVNNHTQKWRLNRTVGCNKLQTCLFTFKANKVNSFFTYLIDYLLCGFVRVHLSIVSIVSQPSMNEWMNARVMGEKQIVYW